MKEGIDYYSHDVESHTHPKFGMLRGQYGWAGEGMFWALNNMIAKTKDCKLDMNTKINQQHVAGTFGMTFAELDKFLDFLEKECDLIINDGGIITTDEVQKVYKRVMTRRKKDKQTYELAQLGDRLKNRPEEETNIPEEETSIPAKEMEVPDEEKKKIRIMKDKLANWYKFNEMNHYTQLAYIHRFLIFIYKKDQLDHFIKQFKAYVEYKNESKEKVHSMKKFLGEENRFMDGAWNSINWEQERDIYRNRFGTPAFAIQPKEAV